MADKEVRCAADVRIKDPAGWGFEGETPPGLQRFVVELDQRFLTELAQTAALFEELFEAGGRKRLIKVPHSPSPTPCACMCLYAMTIAASV